MPLLSQQRMQDAEHARLERILGALAGPSDSTAPQAHPQTVQPRAGCAAPAVPVSNPSPIPAVCRAVPAPSRVATAANFCLLLELLPAGRAAASTSRGTPGPAPCGSRPGSATAGAGRFLDPAATSAVPGGLRRSSKPGLPEAAPQQAAAPVSPQAHAASPARPAYRVEEPDDNDNPSARADERGLGAVPTCVMSVMTVTRCVSNTNCPERV